MSKNTRILFIVSLLTAVSNTLVSPVMAQQQPQQKKMIHGGVNQTDFRNKNGPKLNRTDLRDSGGDPFGNDGVPDATSDSFEPPPEMFQQSTPRRIPPPPPQQQQGFGSGVQDSLEDVLDGLELEPQNGMQSGSPMKGKVLQNQPLQNLKQDSPEMDVAWNAWHRRVAEAVYIRFSNMAKVAYPQSRPLGCAITYTVTRDHQVINCRILQGSGDKVFDQMVLQVVSSLNGSALLEFPQGSRRQQVEKPATFEHNFGPGRGFKFIEGDNERVKGQEPAPPNQIQNRHKILH